MKIYMLAEHDDLDEVGETMAEAISTWAATITRPVKVISPTEDDLQVGIIMDVGKKIALKEPVNYLYTLAKEHKAEFVIGIISDDGSQEKVCFFGFEEGKPDINEIAQYLGLKR